MPMTKLRRFYKAITWQSRLRHLSGMQTVNAFDDGELIRPFLAYSKKKLPDIFHFEDDTNRSLDFVRNRIRNHYFPILEEENPKFKQALRYLEMKVSNFSKLFRDSKDIDPFSISISDSCSSSPSFSKLP